MGVHHGEGLSAVFHGSFVHTGVESGYSEDGEQDLADSGFKIKGAEIQPLVDFGSFSRAGSVEAAAATVGGGGFSGEESEHGVGVGEGTFGGGQSGNHTVRRCCQKSTVRRITGHIHV